MIKPKDCIPETYIIRDDNSVITLSVDIGDGQLGTTLVILGNSQILPINEIYQLGKAQDIKDKIITLKTLIHDVVNGNLNTSVMYHLKGGTEDKDYLESELVDNDLDSIIYKKIFNLKV